MATGGVCRRLFILLYNNGYVYDQKNSYTLYWDRSKEPTIREIS